MRILVNYAELRSFIEAWEPNKAEESVAFQVTDPNQVWAHIQAKAEFEDNVLYEKIYIMIPITAEKVSGEGLFSCKIGELASALRAVEPDDGQIALVIEEGLIIAENDILDEYTLAVGEKDTVHIPYETFDWFPPLSLFNKSEKFDLEYDEEKKAILFRVEKKEKLQTVYVKELHKFGEVLEYLRLRQLLEEDFMISNKLDENATYITEDRTPRRVRRQQTEQEIMSDGQDPKCVACEGTGKNSHGGVCASCGGQASAAETTAEPVAKPAEKKYYVKVEKEGLTCLLCGAEYTTEKGMTRHFNSDHDKIKWREGIQPQVEAEVDLAADTVSGADLSKQAETDKEPEESSGPEDTTPAGGACQPEGTSSEEPSSEEQKAKRRTKEEILSAKLEVAKVLLRENGYVVNEVLETETIDGLVKAIHTLGGEMNILLGILSAKAEEPSLLSKDELLRQLAVHMENGE